MLNQKAEMGNQSLINLKTIHLAWYPISGKSQGFVLEMKKKKNISKYFICERSLGQYRIC